MLWSMFYITRRCCAYDQLCMIMSEWGVAQTRTFARQQLHTITILAIARIGMRIKRASDIIGDKYNHRAQNVDTLDVP